MTSPYLNAEQAAEYLGKMKDGKPNVRALYEYFRRHPVRVYHLHGGKNVRYHIDDLKALVEFSHVSTDPPTEKAQEKARHRPSEEVSAS